MKMARSGPLLAPPPLPGCIRIVRGKWSMTNGEPSPVHIFRLISTVPCTTHSTECVTRSRRFSRTSSVAGVRRFMFRSPSYVRSVLNPIRLSRRRNDVIIIYKRSSRSRVSRDFRLIVYRRRVRHNNSQYHVSTTLQCTRQIFTAKQSTLQGESSRRRHWSGDYSSATIKSIDNQSESFFTGEAQCGAQ